jgi:uncharacterized protein (TIGR03083 family)
MSIPVLDRHELLHEISDVAERLIAMVEAAPDSSVSVPASPEWSVVEAFAHVATVAPRYAQGPVGAGEWAESADELPDLNARQITSLPSLDVAAVAGELRVSLKELEDVIGSFGEEQPEFRFHGGAPVGADAALGILLGEFVVHGRDIAEALGQPWPIESRHVELILRGVGRILPGWLAPQAEGHTGRYEVRVRGQGTHRFAFAEGRLTMNPDGPFRPDVTISADPASLLLVVYKRRSQWPAIATGRLFAWGRKPWRAFGFAALFHQP